MSAPTPTTQARLDAHRAKEAAERDLHAARVLLNAEARFIARAWSNGWPVRPDDAARFRDLDAAYTRALAAHNAAVNAYVDALTLPEGGAA